MQKKTIKNIKVFKSQQVHPTHETMPIVMKKWTDRQTDSATTTKKCYFYGLYGYFYFFFFVIFEELLMKREKI